MNAEGPGDDAYFFTIEIAIVRPVADSWPTICRITNIGCTASMTYFRGAFSTLLVVL